MPSYRGKKTPVLAACAAALLVVTACGGGGGGGEGDKDKSQSSLPKVAKVESIAKTVPAEIRKSGELKIAMSTSSPPGHFETEQGMKGLDPELAVLVAKVLGLKPKVQGVPLDQIVPGMQAKRYDLVVSQFAPTKDRAKAMDFVDYARTGTSLGVASGNPKKLGFDKLCGVQVGVQKGSSQTVDVIPNMNKKCSQQGKKAVQQKTFRDSSQALLALRSQRIDAVLLDSPVLGYAAKKSNGQLTSVGTIDANSVSVGSVKGSGMNEPVAAALKHLKKDGAYDKLFKKWGVGNTALKSPDEFKLNNVRAE